MTGSSLQELTTAIVAETTNGIVAIDDRGEIVLVNKALQEMFGYSENELLGQKIEMLLPERFRQGHVKQRGNFFSNLDNRPMGVSQVLFGQRKSGSEFPIEVGLSHGKADGKEYACASIIDISLRWNRERELELNRQNLETLVEERTEDLSMALRTSEANSKFLSDMLTTMSHEFRTPLNAVIGFSELLVTFFEGAQSVEDKERAHYAAMINDAANNLLGLVQKTSSMSVISMGDLFANPVSILLEDVVEKAIARSIRSTGEKEFEIRWASSLDKKVLADEVMLVRVIALVLENAAKFSGNEVIITIGCEESPDGKVKLSIRDNGPGIEDGKQDSAFNAFERLNESGGTISGIGLGLTIARAYMTAMKGSVEISEQNSGGTLVELVMPKG